MLRLWVQIIPQEKNSGATNQIEGSVSEVPQDVPVMRVSNDVGQTFGSLLALATKGTS